MVIPFVSLNTDSTDSWERELKVNDTILIEGSYFNNDYFTIIAVNSSYVFTVSTGESICDENSTDYDLWTRVSRCRFDRNVKRIAAKMIWYNIQNTTSYQGDITSETYGGYSVTYAEGEVAAGSGLYPASLMSGLKKVARVC